MPSPERTLRKQTQRIVILLQLDALDREFAGTANGRFGTKRLDLLELAAGVFDARNARIRSCTIVRFVERGDMRAVHGG